MLSFRTKTSLRLQIGLRPTKTLFWICMLLGMGVGFGQVDVEFSQATGSDDEDSGGNLPELLVTGTVLVPTTVTVTDAGTGTATSGIDYDFTSPQVVNIPVGIYPPGSSIPIPTLAITGDTTVEPNETLNLGLSGETGNATLGAQTTTTYTITNDDVFIATITATDNTATEAGPTTGTYTVSLDVANNSGSPLLVGYTVGGTATSVDDYAALSGTVSIPNGSDQATITLTPVDDLDVEAAETVIVTLSAGAGYTVGAPASGTVTITSDDVAPDPVATILATDNTATEAGPTTGTYTVSLDIANNSGSPLLVGYTVGGTATSVDDYAALSGTVSIPNGSDQATITLTPVDDLDVEAAETVIVTLSAGAGYTVGAPASGTVTITSDDVAPDPISISDVTLAEGDGATTNFIFTVSVDGGGNAASTIDFDYTTVDGTATTADGDYVLNAGSGQITAGTPSTTITVVVNGDTTVEPTEGFTVVLSNPVNATLTDGTGAGTITNDDSATLTITDESVPENVVGGNMVFTVTLNNAVAGGTQVAYAFTNLTATGSGIDYDNTGGNLLFAGNASETQDITVAINNETIIEGDETFRVTLGIPTNGVTVTGSPAIGTILNDDAAVATITATDNLATESPASTGTFQVNIGSVNNTGSPIPVNYTVTGTATPTADYTALSGTANVANGQQIATITVNPVDDAEIEEDETVIVTLATGAGYSIGAPDSATVTIESEDDTPPDGYTVTINDDPINITNQGAISFTFSNAPTFLTTYDYTLSSSGDGGVATVTGGGALSFVDQTVSNIDVSGLPDGVITLSVVVSNLLGTEGPPTTDTAIKYTAVPSGYTVTIDQSIINFDNQSAIGFTFALAEVGATYNYTFTSDGGGTPVTGSGTIATAADNVNNIDLSGLADGLVTLSVTLSNANGAGVAAEDTSDKDTTVCNAGGVAPVRDTSLPTVFCGDFEIDLNDYVTNIAPVGSELTWSTNPDPNDTEAHRSSVVRSAAQYFGFFYDEVNACASPLVTITLTNFPIPIISDPTGDERCGEGTLTLTASSDSGVLSWFDVPTGGTALGTGGVFITPSISATTSFYVEATANGCTTERIEVVAVVTDAPSTGTPTDMVACNAVSEDGPNVIDLDDTLTGADPGTWALITDPSNGGVAIGAGNTVDFADQPIGDYVFEYTTTGNASTCDDGSVQVTITVEDCFANADIDLALTKEVDNDEPLLDDVITFTITLENTTMDRILDIVVTDLLDTGFEYLSHSASIGTYVPETGEWTIPDLASNVETATLEIDVRVTTPGTIQNTVVLTSSFPVDDEVANNTATASVNVNRDQCTDPGTLCNIFSPNNDGRNDRLILVGHQQFANNTLEVFDRYGNSVFAMDGYDSSWDGTGKNGDLPKGTYFYILDLQGDGTEVIKGWIQIIR